MAGFRRVLALMLTDVFVMFAVWSFDVWFYQAIGIGRYRYGWEYYLHLWPALLFFVVLNAAFRLYQGNLLYPAAPVSPVEEMRRLAASALLTHVGIIAYIALTRQTMKETSRVVTVFSGVLTAILAQPARDLARWAMFRFRSMRIPVAVIGSRTTAARVAGMIDGHVYAGFRTVGVFGDDERGRCVEESRQAGVKVLFACQDERRFRVALPEYAKWFPHIEYMPVAETFPVAGAKPVVFGGLCGLEMVNQRRMKFVRVQKWLLDKSLAVLAFLLLSPFFVLIPAAIKLTSRGPVFYRQNRLGKNGRRIRVWKFRSMYANADERLKQILSDNPDKRDEWEKNFKLSDDPRVTPFGRFLRKTSLDELPQLFNVFTGEMALVGPRPIVEKEVERYGAAYSTFASVEPGITGLWQASGRSDTDYARRVALDTYYVLNWSPWLDLWIMKKTVGAVLSLRGAC